MNVACVKTLLDTTEMESCGIYISPEAAGAKAFATGLIKANDRIGDIITE